MPDRKRGKITRESHLPEVDTILRDLESQKRQVLVILFIPSHDKNEQELPAQDQWADAALELFADLFGGGTERKKSANFEREDGANRPFSGCGPGTGAHTERSRRAVIFAWSNFKVQDVA
jgi:hypothetical protein